MDGLMDPQNGNRAFRALSQQDQALVRAIVRATLRHLPVIEAFLDRLSDRKLPANATSLRHLLNISAAQILYLDVPDHAAVNSAVEMARSDPRTRRFGGLVNALLREMIRQREKRLPQLASETVNAPPWFAGRLRAAYGERATAILEALRHEAAIDITVKDDAAGWAERLGGRLLPTGSVRLPSFDGPVTALPGFAEGDWWVQDAAASIPARLFGDLRGCRVADLCAAPGGKTAQLVLAGAEVTALDSSKNRLKRLAGNLERLGMKAETVHADLFDWKPDTAFDAVLLDAPCSSTGTARRHPDIPWTKTPEDVAKLAELQARMLRRALELVRPGGKVVFSNCSLDPLEGEELVAELLRSRTDIARAAIDPQDWPGLEAAVDASGDIRTTPDMLPDENPHFAGLDGFFASVLMRLT